MLQSQFNFGKKNFVFFCIYCIVYLLYMAFVVVVVVVERTFGELEGNIEGERWNILNSELLIIKKKQKIIIIMNLGSCH